MRKISVADYMVEFFIANGVTDVFGYQGGMVCHIFDSLGHYKDKIEYHNCGNEQGAAIAACGYAQATGKLGVAITTSGPGFTNALTGLANAWFDSVPLMLISGQVNTKDKRRDKKLRQYGFQEIQAIEMAKPIVKRAFELDLGMDYTEILSEAYRIAFSNRRGPVYLDVPINVERELVEIEERIEPVTFERSVSFDVKPIIEEVLSARKPIILAGAGINQMGLRDEFREFVDLLRIPVITTMPGIDLLQSDSPYKVGFLGGVARREAGIVLKNTDCVLTIGTRMCNKAIGYNHDDFIPKSTKLIRVEIDAFEVERQLKEYEEDIVIDLGAFLLEAVAYCKKRVPCDHHKTWVSAVNEMKRLLENEDITFGNDFMRRFSELLPDETYFTLDVGNNLVYAAQSAIIKNKTRVFESAGLGAMGYALPAAIGVSLGGKAITVAVMGDGGAQMNIQELNTVARLNLPIKILVMNNHALGHITLFQDHYLEGRRVATVEENNDYYSCDFASIANAYGIRSKKVSCVEDVDLISAELLDENPLLIELEFDDCTMLPNIHGGLDPLCNGPALSVNLVERIQKLMEEGINEAD